MYKRDFKIGIDVKFKEKKGTDYGKEKFQKFSFYIGSVGIA